MRLIIRKRFKGLKILILSLSVYKFAFKSFTNSCLFPRSTHRLDVFEASDNLSERRIAQEFPEFQDELEVGVFQSLQQKSVAVELTDILLDSCCVKST